MGGSDHIDNAVVLCGHRGRETRPSCHEWWDSHTLATGDIFPGQNAATLVEERPHLVKNRKRFRDFIEQVRME